MPNGKQKLCDKMKSVSRYATNPISKHFYKTEYRRVSSKHPCLLLLLTTVIERDVNACKALKNENPCHSGFNDLKIAIAR